MSTKREARKQRAEARRATEEQAARQRKLRSRAIIAVGAVTLIATAFFAFRESGNPNRGRVWSAEHGHWHD